MPPVAPSHALLILIGLMVLGGPVELPEAVLACTLGSVLGALCWYGLGNLLGSERSERAVDRFGKYVLLSGDTYRRATGAYVRHRFMATLIAQLLPTVRLYMPVPAGVLSHPLPSFLTAVSIGSMAWNVSFLFVGLQLQGTGMPPARAALIALSVLISIELLLALGVWWCRQRPRPADDLPRHM